MTLGELDVLGGLGLGKWSVACFSPEYASSDCDGGPTEGMSPGWIPEGGFGIQYTTGGGGGGSSQPREPRELPGPVYDGGAGPGVPGGGGGRGAGAGLRVPVAGAAGGASSPAAPADVLPVGLVLLAGYLLLEAL